MIRKDLEILQYRIEIKMFENNLKNLPMTEILKQFKNNLTSYMADACEYRIIATNFICIVSTWEQQLFNFCNKFIKKVNNNYHDIKKEYINTGVDTILFENLKEYRWVCNVLKHGKETRNFTKLKENNSIFIKKI